MPLVSYEPRDEGFDAGESVFPGRCGHGVECKHRSGAPSRGGHVRKSVLRAEVGLHTLDVAGARAGRQGTDRAAGILLIGD